MRRCRGPRRRRPEGPQAGGAAAAGAIGSGEIAGLPCGGDRSAPCGGMTDSRNRLRGASPTARSTPASDHQRSVAAASAASRSGGSIFILPANPISTPLLPSRLARARKGKIAWRSRGRTDQHLPAWVTPCRYALNPDPGRLERNANDRRIAASRSRIDGLRRRCRRGRAGRAGRRHSAESVGPGSVGGGGGKGLGRRRAHPLRRRYRPDRPRSSCYRLAGRSGMPLEDAGHGGPLLFPLRDEKYPPAELADAATDGQSRQFRRLARGRDALARGKSGKPRRRNLSGLRRNRASVRREGRGRRHRHRRYGSRP